MSDNLVPKTGTDRNGHQYTRKVKPTNEASTARIADVPATPAKVVKPSVADITNDERPLTMRAQTRYPVGIKWAGDGLYRVFFASQARTEDYLEVRGTKGDATSIEDDASTLADNSYNALDQARFRNIANAAESGDDYSLEVMTQAKESAEEQSGLSLNYGDMQTIYQFGRFIDDEFENADPDVKADALSTLVLERVTLGRDASPQALWTAYDVYARTVFFARVDPYI